MFGEYYQPLIIAMSSLLSHAAAHTTVTSAPDPLVRFQRGLGCIGSGIPGHTGNPIWWIPELDIGLPAQHEVRGSAAAFD